MRPPHSHNWHLIICPTTASRLVSWHRRNWCQVSAARKWQLASAAKCLPTRSFLKGPMRWKSLHIWSCGSEGGPSPLSHSAAVNYKFGWQHGAQWFPSLQHPWRSTWMATDWQQMLTQSKLSPPTHRHLILISSTIFREDSVLRWCQHRVCNRLTTENLGELVHDK